MVSLSRTNSGSSQETRSSSFETLCHKSAGLKKLSFRSAYAPSGTGNANAHLGRQRFVSLTQIRSFRVLCFPIVFFLMGFPSFVLSLPSYYACKQFACVCESLHSSICLFTFTIELRLLVLSYLSIHVCVVSS